MGCAMGYGLFWSVPLMQRLSLISSLMYFRYLPQLVVGERNLIYFLNGENGNAYITTTHSTLPAEPLAAKLKDLAHPNLLRLIEFGEMESPTIWILTEPFEVDLTEVLAQRKDIPMNESHMAYFAKEVSKHQAIQ